MKKKERKKTGEREGREKQLIFLSSNVIAASGVRFLKRGGLEKRGLYNSILLPCFP